MSHKNNICHRNRHTSLRRTTIGSSVEGRRKKGGEIVPSAETEAGVEAVSASRRGEQEPSKIFTNIEKLKRNIYF